MSKNEDAWAWLWVFITFVVVPNLLFNPYINHLWKPPVPKPDNNCKTRNDLQACKVTLKGFERIDKGWIMYVEGNEPYQVYTSFKPIIGENKYLTIYVEKTEDWWTLRDWYVRDVFSPKTPAQNPQRPTSNQQNNCDSSYPDVCIPLAPPDLNCGDISYKRFRVLAPDPHRFDKDKDGIGCG